MTLSYLIFEQKQKKWSQLKQGNIRLSLTLTLQSFSACFKTKNNFNRLSVPFSINVYEHCERFLSMLQEKWRLYIPLHKLQNNGPVYVMYLFLSSFTFWWTEECTCLLYTNCFFWGFGWKHVGVLKTLAEHMIPPWSGSLPIMTF